MCPDDQHVARVLPKIDFNALHPDRPGCEGWAEVRAQVADAVRTYGCFEAVYNKVTPELKEKVFGSVVKDMFNLPLEAKHRNVSDKPFHGYLGKIPNLMYESLTILHPHQPDGVKAFADLMWPQSTPATATFCETVCGLSKLLVELDRMVGRMVLESFGVEKHYDSLMNTNKFMLRVSEYPAPDEDEEKKQLLGLVPHHDKNVITIVCQNQVDGLDIETQDGQWIRAMPSPSSVIIFAGEAIRAWTNGRTYSPLHNVKVGGSETRYSTIMFSLPDDNFVIEPLPELVDESHPALFRPYTYGEFVRFCHFEGRDEKCPHDAFCRIAP
ncbi:Iron/ascorbate family oxidoreductases protein [Dioscorea alata]|uniref:Iron/ascorbate family oxidoreductases protein n=2 Tax=Dioscorea alata TaxID=55571 RepID=A0ACB7TVN9_DIOAL|nr:Iron/ascorbate family oxidoreductases protein [Dioscorea alata]KAH7652097.1 Iron/ascorbate family oxidoreductases protein [Dioscorea alata]